MAQTPAIDVESKPTFDLSEHLYMQHMEPLGVTDGSVEAGWDFGRSEWREDLVAVVGHINPPMIRFGGQFSSYYRWREAVGPREKRKPLMNLCWGGLESNHVGTHEFVRFCRNFEARPLISVNFESDGKPYYARTPAGERRTAGPEEAAAWVDYCNNPENRQRKIDGSVSPLLVKHWQLGNETSYGERSFSLEKTVEKTLAFAEAMKTRDPSLELIGWGEGGPGNEGWARTMAEQCGEHLTHLAFHHRFDSGLGNSPLVGAEWRKSKAGTWKHLMNAGKSVDLRIKAMREEIADHSLFLALTESHFDLPGRNGCEVLATWAAGVAGARILNVHERHGDVLKIATLATFFGTQRMVNAIMIPVPPGGEKRPFVMPVGRVMALYRNHAGNKALDVKKAPTGLDVTASRTGKKVFLHVVNTNRTKSIPARIALEDLKITESVAFEIAADPFQEIDENATDRFAPEEKPMPLNRAWTFPPASVTAVELTTAPKK